MLRDAHEYCLCFSKGRFDRVVQGVADISAAEFCASTLPAWQVPPEQARRVGHAAPFPVELVRRFVRRYTYRDKWVLDPLMGSGTTAVAAVTTGRRWVGYELDPTDRALTRRRVAAAEAVLALGV